jgi:hypothetical protein
MVRSGNSHLLKFLRQTQYDASCSAQVVAETGLLTVAATIQSALAIQAQGRLYSGYKRALADV